MGGVDFVKSDAGKDRSKGNGYEVEYTHPDLERDITKPKRPNLIGGLLSRSATPKPLAKPIAKVEPQANSAQAPSSHVASANTYQPVAQQATSTKTVATKSSTPLPPTATLREHHLPPPPPPPVHASAPVVQTSKPSAPVMQPAVAPVVTTPIPAAPAKPVAQTAPKPEPVSTVTPVLAPTMPAAPVQPARVIPAAPAAPASAPAVAAASPVAPLAVGHRAVRTAEIVAQNVTSMRGETTHPDPLEPQLVNVNLLPNAIQQPLHQRSPLYRLLRLGSVTMLMCTIMYLALVAYQGIFIVRTQSTLTELTGLDDQILAYRQLQADINDTNHTLTSIQALLDDHIYWSQWFTYLEGATLPTVYYVGFSGSANGVMNLQAVAPDFATITQQIAVFEALPEVNTVSVSNAQHGEDSFATATGNTNTTSTSTVLFNIGLQVDPSVLHYQPNGLYEQTQ